MLTWWQWLILAAVPPAIVALYFLKLKRRPMEVPSTYLWHKSIEDLHVNTHLAAAAAEPAVAPATAARGAGDAGPAAARLAGREAPGQPLHLPDRQLGQHAGHRRDALAAGGGQAAGGGTDRPDALAATWPWSSASPTRPGSNRRFTDDRGRLRAASRPSGRRSGRPRWPRRSRWPPGLANPGRSARTTRLRGRGPAGHDCSSSATASSSRARIRAGQPGAGIRADRDAPGGQRGHRGLQRAPARDPAGPIAGLARLDNFGPEETTVSLELRLDGQLIDASKATLSGRGDSPGGPGGHAGVAAGANGAGRS